jgi:uncharacterized protein (DUF427 family)
LHHQRTSSGRTRLVRPEAPSNRRLTVATEEKQMKATIDGAVIADAPESDLITIEGNQYFPPASLSAGAFSESATPYTCPWKGAAQYHDVTVDGSVHHDAAWSYPDPYPASFDRVGSDYTGYVAFDKKQVAVD